MMPLRGLGFLLMLAGVLAFFVFHSAGQTMGERLMTLLVCGSILAIGAYLVIIYRVFVLALVTASGEVTAYRSRDERLIDRLVAAIAEAMSVRG